jgi:hypothetical protein
VFKNFFSLGFLKLKSKSAKTVFENIPAMIKNLSKSTVSFSPTKPARNDGFLF